MADIYLRITADLEGRGLGVERQQQDALEFAKRKRWTPGVVHIDNDVSASRYGRKPRTAYRALLERIKANACDRVVIWDIDRLLRQPRELEDLIDLVEHRTVEVHNLNGELDLRTSDGRFIARILVAKAAKEADDVSRRAKRKKLQLAETGLPAGGGRRPFGWEPDRLTPRKAEADALAEAADAVLAGESLAAIVRRWTEHGPPPASGTTWRTNAVRKALLSPRNAGLREHQSRIVGEATWPAIIDRITWERLRAVLTDPARRTTTNVRVHLLSGGTIVCGRCGHRLAGKPSAAGAAAYHCPPQRGGCGGTYVRAEPVEDLVLDGITEAVDAGQLPTQGDDSDRWLAQLAELEEDRAFLAEQWARGDITRTEWARARQTLDGRIEEARGKAHRRDVTAVQPYLGVPGALSGAWEDLTLETKRAVVATYIDRVTVAPPLVRGLNRFDERRITIDWAD